MESIILTTYRPDDIYSHPHFFILNLGMNTGKPLSYPAANTYDAFQKRERRKNAFTGHATGYGAPIHF